MKFIKYLFSLLKELMQYAWQRKIWWIGTGSACLLRFRLLIVVGETAAPAFIYTLFYRPMMQQPSAKSTPQCSAALR